MTTGEAFDLVKAQLSLATAFLDLAETTVIRDGSSQSRNHAGKAYEYALELLPRVQLPAGETLMILQQFHQVHERLVGSRRPPERATAPRRPANVRRQICG